MANARYRVYKAIEDGQDSIEGIFIDKKTAKQFKRTCDKEFGLGKYVLEELKESIGDTDTEEV